MKKYKKTITPTWNDEFEFQDDSYSVTDIQEWIEYIIKKHETLTTIPFIHVYINKINNKLVLKMKDGYKLELQTPDSMKLFGSSKQLIDKSKNGEKLPSLKVVEVALVQWNFLIICINKSLKYYILLLQINPMLIY